MEKRIGGGEKAQRINPSQGLQYMSGTSADQINKMPKGKETE